VTIAIGFDDGHQLRGPGVFTQHPHVVRDRAEVYHRLGEHPCSRRRDG
jgi:hypothetical protein